MISYNINEPASRDTLYRYCKDEGLDYQSVASGLDAERRTAIVKIREWLLRRASSSKRFESPDRAQRKN